jgi:hypothetical protein
MTVEGAIGRARVLAEQLMVDACVIKRAAGETTGAGGVITPATTTLYTGKCRVQGRPGNRQGTDVGEAYLVIEHHEVQLPMTVAGLREGDQITITASALDPDLVGKVYVIRDVLAKTHLTSRRVEVLEVTS